MSVLDDMDFYDEDYSEGDLLTKKCANCRRFETIESDISFKACVKEAKKRGWINRLNKIGKWISFCSPNCEAAYYFKKENKKEDSSGNKS